MLGYICYISVNLFETSAWFVILLCVIHVCVYIYIFVKPFGTSALVCHTKCYNIYIYVKPFGTSELLCRIPVAYRAWWVSLRSMPVSVGGDACASLLVEYHIYTVPLLASNPPKKWGSSCKYLQILFRRPVGMMNLGCLRHP